MNRCTATTKDDKPCQMAAMKGSTPPTCFNHAPDNAEARARARKAGGKLRGAQLATKGSAKGESEADDVDDAWWAELYTTLDVEGALQHIAIETIAGRMSPRQAQAATNALRLLTPLVVKAEDRGRVAPTEEDDIAEHDA